LPCPLCIDKQQLGGNCCDLYVQILYFPAFSGIFLFFPLFSMIGRRIFRNPGFGNLSPLRKVQQSTNLPTPCPCPKGEVWNLKIGHLIATGACLSGMPLLHRPRRGHIFIDSEPLQNIRPRRGRILSLSCICYKHSNPPGLEVPVPRSPSCQQGGLGWVNIEN